MMKSVPELAAALHMVLARLDSQPKTSAEWEAIFDALREASRYALKKLQEER
jgi:hypothetical protein